MSPDHNTHLPTLYLKHAGWDTLEKLALAALDQGNLEIADVRVHFHAPLSSCASLLIALPTEMHQASSGQIPRLAARRLSHWNPDGGQ